MSFADLQTEGQGTLRFRLMVEGWPQTWVSHPEITATDILDGRTVVDGLVVRGEIGDRVLLREGKIEAKAPSIRLVPPNGDPANRTDPLIASLGLYPEDVTELAADLDPDATVIDAADPGLADNTVYHLGTEAIRTGTYPDVERHVWDTQRQRHNIASWDRSLAVRIYAHPPTMEGRRCFLYVYGEEDDVAGEGTLIWRGMVARAPRLDEHDGVSWVLDVLPITHVLRQTVAGGRGETELIGIYHHWAAAASIQLHWDGTQYGRHHYSGFDPHEDSLIESLNALIADALADAGASEIDSLTVQATSLGLRLELVCSVQLPPFILNLGSSLVGFWDNTGGIWWHNDAGERALGFGADLLDAGTWYLESLGTGGFLNPAGYQGAPAYALGNVAAIRTVSGRALFADPAVHTNPDPAARAEFPEWRLYTSKSLEGATAVHLTGLQESPDDIGAAAQSPAEQTFTIALAGTQSIDGTTYHFADLVEPPDGGFRSWIGPESGTTITPVRRYSPYGTVADFVQGLKNESENANDGDTPWITDVDLADWEHTRLASDQRRVYEFTRETAVEDILIPELQIIAHVMRIEADGRIGCVPVPLPTEAYPVDSVHTLTEATICTPPTQTMPAHEPQRDGVLSTLTIQDGYNPTADEWTEPPQIYDAPDVIATHKRRGVAQMEIKPFSRPVVDQHGFATSRTYTAIAARYLSLFGRDYVVITVTVPWRHFAVLCVDIVNLSHSLVPGGDGMRGITARSAMCVGRTWDLDPGRNPTKQGTLELWMPAQPVYGYAASGAVTDRTQIPETTNFEVELDPAHADNIRWSPNGDGKVLQRFDEGDNVSLIEVDSEAPTVVHGTIHDIDADAGTCRIDTAGWGAGDYRLEFRSDTTGSLASASQRRSAYVADDAGTLPDGSRGKRLS